MAGTMTLAQPLYEQARELAVGAGDVVLAVHVLTSQSMLYAEMARTGPSRESARQALRLAFQAAGGRPLHPRARLHALIALRHASAASLLGDKAAFQAAIVQARRELDRGPRDGDPPRMAAVRRRDRDHRDRGPGWLDLGDAPRSARLYRQVLAAGLSTRNRASYGAGLADALLKQGARQDAIAAAMDVLPALEGGVTSMRCLNRLRLIRQAAGNIAGAREFCERFDAAERALTASCAYPASVRADARAAIPALPAMVRVVAGREAMDSHALAIGREGPCLTLRVNVAHAGCLIARRLPPGFLESRTGQVVPAWATSTQSLPPVLWLDLRHGLVRVVSCALVIASPSLAC